MGEYIDGMLITLPGCCGAVSRANRLDERIMSQSGVDSLGSNLAHNRDQHKIQHLDPNETLHSDGRR